MYQNRSNNRGNSQGGVRRKPGGSPRPHHLRTFSAIPKREEDDMVVNYKNLTLLKKYISNVGRILPRRVTGFSAKIQRKITAEIKIARFLALLPYTDHKK